MLHVKYKIPVQKATKTKSWNIFETKTRLGAETLHSVATKTKSVPSIRRDRLGKKNDSAFRTEAKRDAPCVWARYRPENEDNAKPSLSLQVVGRKSSRLADRQQTLSRGNL